MPHLSHPNIIDHAERELALDTTRSFIVQAPAGSGKTSLLVQRYLALLAQVKNPEEILAITFTNKAAKEMLNRISDALIQAANPNFRCENPYVTQTHELAKRALQQNSKYGWNIQNNCKRLKIQTIDSWCHAITKLAPITCSITSDFNIVTDTAAKECYRQASLNSIKYILNDTENRYYQFLENLLLHLDNDVDRLIKLFTEMLKCREQWLPHIVSAKNDRELRQNIESGLLNIVEENIERCKSTLPQHLFSEITTLAKFAANNRNFTFGPFTNISTKEDWLFLADLLLTKNHAWRTTTNKTQGFPSPITANDNTKRKLYREMKERIQILLTELVNHEEFRFSLVDLVRSPPSYYTQREWQIISILLELLPLLVAELKILFNERSCTDHSEICMAACQALGTTDAPNDLALNLDHRLQHLLIDEFQDTSAAQFRLLEKITTGWQSGDGRTLFAVGDPMQSIYRFRDADVGLFLCARQHGIGNVKLEPLTLRTNFRSTKNIVDWINANFVKILPKTANVGTGAVTFNPSVSAEEEKEITAAIKAINIKILIDGIDDDEAKEVVKTIQSLQARTCVQERIAILVKARNHLQAIMPALRAANIDYQAIELETLSQNPAISDLLSLTRALNCLVDRIAWLAILRAPWLGLDLKDLHAIANGKSTTIFENLLAYRQLNLSFDAMIRLETFVPIIAHSIDNRCRQSQRFCIEETWLKLGGPAGLAEQELDYSTRYFELLDQQEHREHFDLNMIEKQLAELYAPANSYDANSLQIMTIHKAKGLEFDHVIVPALHRAKHRENTKLLLWHERPRLQKTPESDLLLAPIKAVGEDSNPIYDYLRICEQRKDRHETERSLYVAATRAKKSLHLFGLLDHSDVNKMMSKNNLKGSFLELLALCFSSDWLVHKKEVPRNNAPIKETVRTLYRLPTGWQNPYVGNQGFRSFVQRNAFLHSQTSWQDNSAAIIGILVHRILQQLSHKPLPIDTLEYIKTQQIYWRNMLLELGLNENILDISLQTINHTIEVTLNDRRGRWILDHRQKAAASEYALTTLNENQNPVHLIIDRTFITKNGTRWIIDYKIAQKPLESDIISFLQKAKEQHRLKLTQYAKAMSCLETIPNRLALYFPNWGGWAEIDQR